MTRNEILLQKVDTTLNELAAGGLLVAGQADKFIRTAIIEASMVPLVDVFGINAASFQRPRARFAGRVLQPGAEAAALAFAQRVSPTLANTQYDTRLYKAEARMSDESLDDNIEAQDLKVVVQEELNKGIGRDIELFAIQGDTTSADAGLAVQDGWIRRATANQVAGGVAQLNANLLRDGVEVLPDEFQREDRIKIFTNYHATSRYQDAVAGRATVSGDQALIQQATAPNFRGIQIVRSGNFPNALGAGANETVVLIGDPKVFGLGFQRRVQLESARDAHAGVVSIIASVRMAINLNEVNAVARINAVVGR